MTQAEVTTWTIIFYAILFLVLYLSRDTKPKV